MPRVNAVFTPTVCFLANIKRWGCGSGRIVTVPYTASSVLTRSEMLGGQPPEKRDIPFFFVGTARNRLERMNLDVGRINQPSPALTEPKEPLCPRRRACTINVPRSCVTTMLA